MGDTDGADGGGTSKREGSESVSSEYSSQTDSDGSPPLSEGRRRDPNRTITPGTPSVENAVFVVIGIAIMLGIIVRLVTLLL